MLKHSYHEYIVTRFSEGRPKSRCISISSGKLCSKTSDVRKKTSVRATENCCSLLRGVELRCMRSVGAL